MARVVLATRCHWALAGNDAASKQSRATAWTAEKRDNNFMGSKRLLILQLSAVWPDTYDRLIFLGAILFYFGNVRYRHYISLSYHDHNFCSAWIFCKAA